MADIESTQGDYPVRLEAFEGPLDLLLYLIKKDEVDIHDIPIESITRQFNEYLGMMKLLDLNIAGEFLVMSATLMHIKSRMLLPEEERTEELEDEDDPRWDLVRQLVEYKKFRDAALHLEKLEDNQHNVLLPPAEGVDLGQEPGLAIRDVSLFDLVRTLGEVLARARREVPHEIAARAFSVAEKIDHIVRLTEELPEDGGVSLLGLFEGMEHRAEVVCTFLAVLELIRMRRIRAVQTGLFGDIEVRRAPPPPPPPAPDPSRGIPGRGPPEAAQARQSPRRGKSG
ncbi:MAG: segregation/condensation protein A [Kiritimatiellia bacterium]